MKQKKTIQKIEEQTEVLQPYEVLPKTNRDLSEITIKATQSWGETLSCKYNSAEVYHKYYKIYFTDGPCHLDQKIEPYPHKFLMAFGKNKKLLGSIGLYTHNCYVSRFGQVTSDDIQALLEEASCADYYDPTKLREITKVAIKEEKKGVAKLLLSFAHSIGFFNPEESTQPYLLVICATQKIFKNFWDALGIRTRFIKTFPLYKVHEFYRDDENPMESRLIIPRLDIPEQILHQKIPYKILSDNKVTEWLSIQNTEQR